MRRILIILAFLVLVPSVCFGQMRSSRGIPAPSPLTGNPTDGYTLPGSLSIPATNPSTIGSLESGNSKYAINGNTTLTTSQLNRIYTLSLATSPIVKVDTLDAQTYFVGFQNTTIAGEPGGVTVWSNHTLRKGFGASATSGNTFWVNGTGNTRYRLMFEVYKVGANLELHLAPTDASVFSK